MGLVLKYLNDTSALTADQGKYGFNYRNGCDVCPLRGNKAPKVEPYGSDSPTVYMLGDKPSFEDVKGGRPFNGAAGDMLRRHLPKWVDERDLRWSNCLKSRPPKGRDPAPGELASCRSYIEDDILATRPKAIFGFGVTPLSWMGIADSGINAWAGRYVPVRIKDHVCWYFPMMDPGYVLQTNGAAYKPGRDRFKTETEFAFHVHLKRAFELVDDIDVLGEPEVHTRADAMDGIDTVMRYDLVGAQRIIKFIESMYDEDAVGLDYETNGTRPYPSSVIRPKHPEPKILSCSLSSDDRTLAWPIRHREAQWSPEHLNLIEDALEEFLHTSKCRKVSHNAAFEFEWTAEFYGRAAIRTDTWDCTMSQAYILDERTQGGNPGPQSLDWLTRQYFGLSIKSLNPLDRANLDDAPLHDVLPYNGCDSKYHLKGYRKLTDRLKREGLRDVYREHMRRVRAAVFTGIKGLPINQAVNKRLTDKYTAERGIAAKQIAETEAAKDFFGKKGRDLTPSSNPDVLFLLNDVLPEKATKRARNKNGDITNVNEGTLNHVDDDIAKLILDWRKANKTITTYLEPMRPGSKLLFDDNLLHPQTRTTTVVTWRTSADGPTYQNWTKRHEVRREVRGQVQDPRPGYKIVSFDYAGIQARNVAMESKDPELVKAFRERYDIHSDWTRQLAKLHPKWFKEGWGAVEKNDKLFRAYRNIIKNKFVFPSLFGARDTTVAHYLEVDDDIGIKLQKMFWDRFGGVFNWHASLFKMYRERGYVTGLSGFRRRAPISANELINTPIQSDEAIIVCDAMARLCDMRRADLQPNMEIHDDLTFIWHEDDLDEYIPIVLDVMLNCPFEWAQIVPLGVEYAIGDNWFQQKAMGEYFTDTWKGKL